MSLLYDLRVLGLGLGLGLGLTRRSYSKLVQ